MTSGETVKISPGRYNYDIFLTSPSEKAVSKLVEGLVTVDKQVLQRNLMPVASRLICLNIKRILL